MGTQLPLSKKGRTAAPNFRPTCCAKTARWIDQDIAWYRGKPRPWPHCVRWGPTKGAQPGPQFLAIVCCGQTAVWIKMPVGREVDVAAGDTVLDGDPAPTKKGHSTPPLFGPCLMWPNGRPCQLLLNTCFLLIQRIDDCHCVICFSNHTYLT